ncbi:glutamate-gated chloride channel isoform X2 [Condylostylus longicornis]|uniref:glutamate-gated chloride channel isoform X2 n=1 Tax=Condylostylus longicornis TaxID=2530218 RepID=UPI00244E0C84|nr:glutamate-gated chloride channel isoform X2 [Condylostylus longicornis]
MRSIFDTLTTTKTATKFECNDNIVKRKKKNSLTFLKNFPSSFLFNIINSINNQNNKNCQNINNYNNNNNININNNNNNKTKLLYNNQIERDVQSQYYIFREYWNKTAQEYMEAGNNLALRLINLENIKNLLSCRYYDKNINNNKNNDNENSNKISKNININKNNNKNLYNEKKNINVNNDKKINDKNNINLTNNINNTNNNNNHNGTIYRYSLSLYTASSVILALCYLTTSALAASTDINPIFDESSSDKEILDHLLMQKRYDKRLLPPVNGTLTVNLNVLLLSLASPDESSLKYEVEFLLNQQWTDPRLQYGNRSQYDFLNALHHHNDIWLPDTYFIMHGDFKDPLIPMHFALRIFRNGTITYAMRRHLILSCQGSLHIFPFDDPKCSFSMESISYELSHIKYIWKNDDTTLKNSPSLTALNAYLISNATILCPIKSWRGNYSCLRVDLTFTRDRAFYFTTVFIPGIILVTSSFITFWLEWNAVPARVMIGVTTMLNFFTTSNGFRSTLPVVSNLTAMNVWDGVCMCFIYASLLEFVCVNYVGRKRPLHNVVYRPGENPVTQRLPAVLSRIGIILASPLGEKRRDIGGPNEIVACTSCGGGTSPCTHSANNGCATETCFVQVRKKEPPHPIRVAKTIDVIARITFPTAYAIFLIFFFVHYKGFS